MSSPSETERAAAAVAGFEIESVLGQGPRGTVYVATQTGLGRRVALKVYPETVDGIGAAWPEHAGVARLHAAGAVAGGGFTASQLAGGSLAARLAARDLAREQALSLCDQAADTLAAVAVAHGALGAGNVLIDAEGRALLCDFGMPGVDASPAADRRALAELRARCRQLPTRGSRMRRRGIALGLATVAAVGAVVVATGALDGAGEDGAAPATAPLPGATILGSRLDGAKPATLGCDGEPPSGSAPQCTVVQLRRDGRPLRFAADGVVRRWSVRGASGDLALQVVRPAAHGRYVMAARSQTEQVTGPSAQGFTTDIAVRRGDLAGIKLEPSAGIGVTRAARDAAALRFVGALHFAPPRKPAPPTATDLDGALELRVEYVPGARPRPIPSLTGGAARGAPAGRRISGGEIALLDGSVRTLNLVLLPGRVALDLLRGRTRLQRLEVVGADPRGRLLAFERFSRLAIGPIVMWRNPGGREVVHDYRARADGLEPID